MTRRQLSLAACAATLGLIAVVGGSIATAADPAKDAKPAAAAPAGGQPEIKLPPGWTEADMKACMEAGTPGKMHEHLAKGIGVWHAKTSMWMSPAGGEPMKSEGTSTVTSMMDGRYIKVEMTGDMPGMGPYHGIGIYGFDNVAQKFSAVWVDNHSTGIMNGTGELSPDGKTLTWTYSFNCPLTKKPTPMREVETVTGPNTKTMEMHSVDPKSGKEYKMMSIEFTKKS